MILSRFFRKVAAAIRPQRTIEITLDIDTSQYERALARRLAEHTASRTPASNPALDVLNRALATPNAFSPDTSKPYFLDAIKQEVIDRGRTDR